MTYEGGGFGRKKEVEDRCTGLGGKGQEGPGIASVGGVSAARRLALVEPDGNVHAMLRNSLRDARQWELESHFAFEQAHRDILSAPPDAVLMGTCLAGVAGIDSTHKLKSALPWLPVAMFTPRPHGEAISQALKAGANGYLVRPIGEADLLPALDKLASGRPVFCDESQGLLAEWLSRSREGDWRATLTLREHQVVACLLRRRSDKAIALELGITRATVHAHLSHIYEKLEVHGRAELLARYSIYH